MRCRDAVSWHMGADTNNLEMLRISLALLRELSDSRESSRSLCTDLPRRWIRPLVWGSSKVWRFSLVRTIIFQNLFKVFSPCRAGNSTGMELNWWQLLPSCILIWGIPWLIKTLKAAKCCSFSALFFSTHMTLRSQTSNLLFSLSAGYQIVSHKGNHFIISRIGFLNKCWRKLSASDSGD